MTRRYALRVAALARQDILQAKAWLTQPGSGPRGHHRYATLNRAVLDLRHAPLRWPIGDNAEVRERPVEGHRLFYSVDVAARTVILLRVFGPFQDRSRP